MKEYGTASNFIRALVALFQELICHEYINFIRALMAFLGIEVEQFKS